MLIISERDERCAQQGAALQIERPRGVLVGEFARACLAGRERDAAQIGLIDGHGDLRMNALHHDTVVVFVQRRAPRFVTLDHLRERLVQQRVIDRTANVPVRSDVISVARVACLREHPETLLCK